MPTGTPRSTARAVATASRSSCSRAAHAAIAGVDEAKPMIDETFALLEKRFWDADAGLYVDEATPDWQLSDYRDQNANMPATEALLAAYEATGMPFIWIARKKSRGISPCGRRSCRTAWFGNISKKTGPWTGITMSPTVRTSSVRGTFNRDTKPNGRSCC